MATSDGSSRALSKRPRADSDDSSTPLQHKHYTIGWICALPVEMSTAEAMLDRTHDPLPRRGSDINTYTLGSIGAHNVVIACLPKGQYGDNNAATVASNMVSTFEGIKHGLLVGIGGAIPGSVDVRLGDVVISTEVIQYDLGKAMPNSHFQRTGYPTRPPQPLLTAVSKLQASHDRSSSQIPQILNRIVQRNPEMVEFGRPRLQDRLFRSEYLHAPSADSCDDCDESRLVHRQTRDTLDPRVHYGLIASGNQVIKDAETRDQLAKELNGICFEMEAAGLMSSFPSLVIRGICDYSDSHKNKQWQKYAAAVAAAYAKELLLVLPAPMLDLTDHTTLDDILHLLRAKRTKTTHPQNFSLNDEDAERCLRALFITDPTRDRDDIIDARGDICHGTCEWILSTNKFRTWQQTSPHLLWISAPPGKGKTYMSIYLSQYFQQVAREESSTETIFFFCDNKHETRNTTINILRGLMYQLVWRQRDLIYVVLPHWKTQSSALFEERSFNTLWRLFEDMLMKLEASVVYCVIDGLDECEQTSLSSLLRKFEMLSKNTAMLAVKMKLVCLSRRYPESIPEALFSFQKFDLDVAAAAKDDVKLFISRRVLELSEKKNLPPKLRDQIEKTFQQQSEDTFLWVSYMAQYLERKNLWEIEASLNELPQGLDAVYERILSQIDLRNQDIILRILDWILVAIRPLKIPELCEAVQIQATESLRQEEICLSFIQSCGHFLQVTLSSDVWSIPHTNWYRRPDGSEAEPETEFNIWRLEVTFIHQSAKDYLVKRRRMTDLQSHTSPMQQLNEYVASHLIGYMSNHDLHKRIDRTRGLSMDSQRLNTIRDKYPLASYALYCWHHHFRELDEICQIIWQNEEFFAIHSEVRAACCKFLPHVDLLMGKAESLVPLLHMACVLDLCNLVKWNLEQRSITDIEIRWGVANWTPIFVACDLGHEKITFLLLDAGANITGLNGSGARLFSAALRTCGRDLLRRLATDKRYATWLKQESSNGVNNYLASAACHGNEEACRYLVEDLEYDVNQGRGFMRAVEMGHVKLARIFVLEWNARFDYVDVWNAACNSTDNKLRFEPTMRMIIDDFSVDINAADRFGCNVLCTIFRLGGTTKQGMDDKYDRIKAMLQRGCDPSKLNHMGQTPLHCVAKLTAFPFLVAATECLELLLRNGKSSINHVCQNARTILHYFMEQVVYLAEEILTIRFDLSYEYMETSLVALQRLLDLGVNRHLRNKGGRTAVDMLIHAFERNLGTDGLGSKLVQQDKSRYFNWLREMILILESYHTVVKEFR